MERLMVGGATPPPVGSAAPNVLPRSRREVIGVEIVLVESEADRIDPELVRHVP